MFPNMFSGFDALFTVGPPIITIGFIVILTMIISGVIRGGIRWSKNNNSPTLTIRARIVTKRMAVGHHTHIHSSDVAMNHTSSSTVYYATFEVETGNRLEFRIPNSEYGMLSEGDNGELTFQGTRYKGFERLR